MSKEQVGFMKAPDINAKKSMSKSTRPPPIANPPNFSSHLYGGLLLKWLPSANHNLKPLLQILMVEDKHNLEDWNQAMLVFLYL